MANHCFPVAHRQVVLTIPKRLRLHTRFDRKLLGKLCSCAWACIQAEVHRLLGRDDVLPGMVAAIQTHGELLHWHPHIHALVTCGAFTPQGEFLEVPEFDIERLRAAWREAVFALYLAEGKIEPEVVENMRSLAAQRLQRRSVGVPAGRRPGGHRAAGAVHDPLPVQPVAAGQGDRRPGRSSTRRRRTPAGPSPSPQGDGLASGPKRNFQILSPLEFLAEFTQHIPPKGAHLIRYYGWYSNKARGMRRKAAAGDCPDLCVSDNGTVTWPPRRFQPPAAAARPGPCSSSGCTRSTRWPVRSAAAR